MQQFLRVATAPASEPVSVALARQHCRIDEALDDGLLALNILTARTMAEEYLSRALITQSLLWSMSETAPTGALAPGWAPQLQVLPLAFTWLSMQRQPVDLPRSPVRSIDAVQVLAADGTATPVAAGGYDALLGSEPARLRLRQATPPGGGLAVAFTAGYGDNGDAVPAPIRQAILFLTAWLFENRGDVGGEWPAVAYRLLAPYRLMSFGG